MPVIQENFLLGNTSRPIPRGTVANKGRVCCTFHSYSMRYVILYDSLRATLVSILSLCFQTEAPYIHIHPMGNASIPTPDLASTPWSHSSPWTQSVASACGWCERDGRKKMESNLYNTYTSRVILLTGVPRRRLESLGVSPEALHGFSICWYMLSLRRDRSDALCFQTKQCC